MDAEDLEFPDISHHRGGARHGQRPGFHTLPPCRRVEVFHDRVQPYRPGGGRKGRVIDRILDRHDEQSTLLSLRVRLGHEPDQPVPPVNHSRPREPLPQRGVVRNAAVDIERDEAVWVARSAGWKQSAFHLLAVAKACWHGVSIRKAHRDALAGPFTGSGQANKTFPGRIPTLTRSRRDLEQDQIASRVLPSNGAIDPGVR